MEQIFISHHSKDKAIADVIAQNIEKLTNGNIQFWYSSDSNPEGGMGAGNIIFNEIVKRLNESSATIVLLTPRSVDRPWLLFESGMAQGRENQSVIPVCVGVNKDTIAQPLNNYYCYQLSDFNSLFEFVTKLLGRLKVDKEIEKESLQNFISALQNATRSFSEIKSKCKETWESKLLNEIKVHIDRKFLTLSEIIGSQESGGQISYTVPVYIGIGKNKGTIGYIEVKGADSVQKVLNKIFYLLDGEVKAHTYMSSWILRERHCGAYMIIHEITNLIPANCVFKPNLEWEVVKWDENYDPSKSKFKIGLYPYW